MRWSRRRTVSQLMIAAAFTLNLTSDFWPPLLRFLFCDRHHSLADSHIQKACYPLFSGLQDMKSLNEFLSTQTRLETSQPHHESVRYRNIASCEKRLTPITSSKFSSKALPVFCSRNSVRNVYADLHKKKLSSISSWTRSECFYLEST